MLLLGLHLLASAGATGLATRPEVAGQQITALALAVTAYERDVGRFPSPADGLRALVERPAGPDAEGWQGPYLEPAEVPRDPWGNAYGYSVRPEDADRPFNVYSCGEDGVSASAGNDPDDVGLWPTTAPLASAPTAAPPRVRIPRLGSSPVAIIVVLTVGVALLRRHAGRVARRPQPHANGYVRRQQRRPATARMPPQDAGDLRI